MLTIGKLGATPDQLGYYEQQVAQGMEDYFSGRGEAPGRWIGGGCGGIGLAGQVDHEGFMRAMAGCDPATGDRLRAEHGRTKVAAFDLTFSAPKSVSVLFAIADEGVSLALLDAHERAVAAAFSYVEREACFTRRGRNGTRRVRGEGFVAAAYRHRLSRAGDPQLHTHVVTANMTRAEGRWTTLEAHSLYEHKSAAGALYRAVLRAEVRERLPWVAWREVGRGLFEIEGVPAGVLREFSRRRVEIEERARELTGVTASKLSRERLQGIALATRKAKEYGVDGARWRHEARARAAEHGLGDRELEQLMGRTPRAAAIAPAHVARSATERLSGPQGLTGNHNTFARRHALAELAGEFTQGATVATVEQTTSAYLHDASVVELGQLDDERRFTTVDLLACERAIIDGALRRSGEGSAMLDSTVADRLLAGLEQVLTPEQRAAAFSPVVDGRGVSVLQARAGTGKTRLLGALARVYEAGGCNVIGVASTGRAARELAEAAAVPAFTIHRLIGELEADDLPPRTVILLDEAGTAPTRVSAELFALAQRSGAKIIAAGDGGQLPSVAAGGWFAALAQRMGGPELRGVLRQRDPVEREALEHLRDGDPEPYIEFKGEQKALKVHEHEGGALDAVLTEWEAAQQRYGLAQAVMIARDNDTRALLNDRARALLIRSGVLAGPPVEIGDQQFRVGDRVIARRNDRYRDVDNGMLAQIIAIDGRTGDTTIRSDDGELRLLDAVYTSEHLEPAYALTGHGAHGGTFEWASVVGRPSEYTREWAYTALSRARDETRVHVVAEATARQREREEYAPPEPDRTSTEALEILVRSMRRREAEPLAMDIAATELRMRDPGGAPATPLSRWPESGSDLGASGVASRAADDDWSLGAEPDWRHLREQRSDGRSRSFERDR